MRAEVSFSYEVWEEEHVTFPTSEKLKIPSAIFHIIYSSHVHVILKKKYKYLEFFKIRL